MGVTELNRRNRDPEWLGGWKRGGEAQWEIRLGFGTARQGYVLGIPNGSPRGGMRWGSRWWWSEPGADTSHFGSRLLTRNWADLGVQVKEQSSGKGRGDSEMKSSSEEKEESWM